MPVCATHGQEAFAVLGMAMLFSLLFVAGCVTVGGLVAIGFNAFRRPPVEGEG